MPEETNQVTEGVVRRWLGHYGFIDAAHGSYYFAKVNVIQEQRDRRLKSGDKVRFVVAKHPEPAAEHSSDQNGKAKEIEVISDSFVENEMVDALDIASAPLDAKNILLAVIEKNRGRKTSKSIFIF